MELALNDWTHPRTGVVREYIQNLRELIDFKPEWNKRGRIVGGTLRGQEINGKWAREIDAITAYIEEGEIVILGADDTDRPMVMEAIEDAMHEETKPEQDREIEGEVFACRRTALGLSQSDVARAFGVPQAKVSRWESGKSPIPHGVQTAILDLESVVQAEVNRITTDLEGGHTTVMLAANLGSQKWHADFGVDIEQIRKPLTRVVIGRAVADEMQSGTKLRSMTFRVPETADERAARMAEEERQYWDGREGLHTH